MLNMEDVKDFLFPRRRRRREAKAWEDSHHAFIESMRKSSAFWLEMSMKNDAIIRAEIIDRLKRAS